MTRRGGVAGPLFVLVAVALLGGCGGSASVGSLPSASSPALAASLSPSLAASPAYDSYTELVPGQCFDGITDKDDEALLAVSVKPCDAPHGAEVVGTPRLPDPAGAPFVADAVDSAAQASCRTAFDDYVGIDFDTSALSLRYYTPGEQTWAGGDRTVICTVPGSSANPLTRSVKGLRE